MSRDNGPKIANHEFKQLRDFVENACGISIGDEKTYLMESRLQSLLKEKGLASFGALYHMALENPVCGLRDKLVDAMTTNETLWFRDAKPYAALRHALLPTYVQQIKEGSRKSIKIWSAACATGQEPYSIAISFLETLRSATGVRPEMLQITATDISRTALFAAMNGKYDNHAMSRGITEGNIKSRYFTANENIHLVNDDVKKLVEFKNFNLQDNFSPLGRFDIVFLRNVTIYFSLEFKINLFRKIARQINPGGFLFIGSSESLRGVSDSFAMKSSNDAIYYEVKP